MSRYQYKIKAGDIFKTKDGRTWHIASFDGKFMYTVEGAQYSPNHPDIICFEDCDAMSSDVEKQRNKSSKYSKKKAEETETDSYKVEDEKNEEAKEEE